MQGECILVVLNGVGFEEYIFWALACFQLGVRRKFAQLI